MRENRTCPPEFEAVLAEAGGVNQYGDPIFRLAWSGSEVYRAGGYWQNDGFTGYRPVLARNGPQCWMVMEWQEPGADGSPWLYYHRHRDPQTGLCDVGEYPYHGRYYVIRPLIWSGMIDGKLAHEHLELTGFLLEALLASILAWKALSEDRKRLAIMEEEARKEDELNNLVMEARRSCRPAFGAASAVVAKKVEMFERNWRQIVEINRAMQNPNVGFRAIVNGKVYDRRRLTQ